MVTGWRGQFRALMKTWSPIIRLIYIILARKVVKYLGRVPGMLYVRADL